MNSKEKQEFIEDSPKTYSLNVALVGKPNSGKSSLINKIMKDQICIVSKKPHSTRDPVLAIYNKYPYQIVFVDTPGVNDSMNSDFQNLTSKALACLEESDCGLFIIDATKPIPSYILELAKMHQGLKVALINKIDLINKGKLLPLTAKLQPYFHNIFSISANLPEPENKLHHLIDFLEKNSKENSWTFLDKVVTNKSVISRMKDRVQEILFEYFHKEIPYNITTEMDYVKKNKDYHVFITLFAPKKYKAIILGKIATIAPKIRATLSKYLDRNIHSFLMFKPKKTHNN